MAEFKVDFSNTPFLQAVTARTPALADRPFLDSGQVNRLNWRIEVLLSRNPHLVQDKRILELGSHDGRMSYACLKLGAKYLVGVEGRPELVERCVMNMNEVDIGGSYYDFYIGDFVDFLDAVGEGMFDTILCAGVFYHTIRQVEMMRNLMRIRPKFVILDTLVADYPAPVLAFRPETHTSMVNTIDPMEWVALPSQSWIVKFFEKAGFSCTKLDWRAAGVEDWDQLTEYRDDQRVSYIAELK